MPILDHSTPSKGMSCYSMLIHLMTCPYIQYVCCVILCQSIKYIDMLNFFLSLLSIKMILYLRCTRKKGFGHFNVTCELLLMMWKERTITIACLFSCIPAIREPHHTDMTLGTYNIAVNVHGQWLISTVSSTSSQNH